MSFPNARFIAPVLAGTAIGYAASDPYVQYVAKHKYNVISPMRQMGLGWGQALKHDLSKLGPKEFGPYREYFTGKSGVTGTRDPETYNKWRTAVQHHYHSPGNMHHYRALGLKSTAVPLKYRMEAVADWHSVQKTKGSTHESFSSWFERLRDKLPIDEETRTEINKRLGLTKKAVKILQKIY